MTEYEFNQMVAEITSKHGKQPVLHAMERAAHIFGWPIPAQYRDDVILGLCVIFPPEAGKPN